MTNSEVGQGIQSTFLSEVHRVTQSNADLEYFRKCTNSEVQRFISSKIDHETAQGMWGALNTVPLSPALKYIRPQSYPVFSTHLLSTHTATEQL